MWFLVAPYLFFLTECMLYIFPRLVHSVYRSFEPKKTTSSSSLLTKTTWEGEFFLSPSKKPHEKAVYLCANWLNGRHRLIVARGLSIAW